MKVTFARPDIADLVFFLYGRSVHPELFKVYAEAVITHSRYTAHLRICDAGHVVEFRYGDRTITEVTAARQQALPEKRRVLERRIRGSRDDAHFFQGGPEYQVSYQLEQLDPVVYMNFHEELLVDCCRADVAYRFPTETRLAPTPLSLIRTDASSTSLLIHSYHTFPDRHAVMKTQSLFEL